MSNPYPFPFANIPESWTTSNAMKARCKPWLSGKTAVWLVHVRTDGTVCVYDSVAGYFTSVHALTTEAQVRLSALYRRHVAKLLKARASCPARQPDTRQTV